jgi:hypothetical protein
VIAPSQQSHHFSSSLRSNTVLPILFSLHGNISAVLGVSVTISADCICRNLLLRSSLRLLGRGFNVIAVVSTAVCTVGCVFGGSSSWCLAFATSPSAWSGASFLRGGSWGGSCGGSRSGGGSSVRESFRFFLELIEALTRKRKRKLAKQKVKAKQENQVIEAGEGEHIRASPCPWT